jgi:hypothetical protein
MLLGHCNAKVDWEDTFKPTNGYKSLHDISNNNGIGEVHFAISKHLTVKSKILPQYIQTVGNPLMGKPTIILIIL